MLIPTSEPRKGMKCNKPAMTPHKSGFGKPSKYIQVPTAAPKQVLISVIVTRYTEMFSSICREISTASFLSWKLGSRLTSLRKNRSPDAYRKNNKISITPAPTKTSWVGASRLSPIVDFLISTCCFLALLLKFVRRSTASVTLLTSRTDCLIC